MSDTHMEPFIAVHAGAGYHDQAGAVLGLCKKVAQLGYSLMLEGSTAVEAITSACSMLEKDDLTNCGIGSQLNEDGEVTCDASLLVKSAVTGHQLGTSVSGIATNCPIKVPVAMMKDIMESQGGKRGRAIPVYRSDAGAIKYAKEKGILDSTGLITEVRLQEYSMWKNILESDVVSNATEATAKGSNEKDTTTDDGKGATIARLVADKFEDAIGDTVGVICRDTSGTIAVCASSGGVLLKPSGRVGPAAIIGSGIWISSTSQGTKTAVSCTSGFGEDIINCQLARLSAEQATLQYESQNDWMKNVVHIVESHYFTQSNPLSIGILTAVFDMEDDDNKSVEIICGHTTKSMIYATCHGGNVKGQISRGIKGGITVGSYYFRD